MSKAMDDLHLILKERGQQYGNDYDDKANLREAHRLGVDPLLGVLVRMGDKWARICNLVNGNEPYDPAQLRDQVLDIAGYGVKAMELMDERFFSDAFSERATVSESAVSQDSDAEPQRRRGIRSLLGG